MSSVCVSAAVVRYHLVCTAYIGSHPVVVWLVQYLVVGGKCVGGLLCFEAGDEEIRGCALAGGRGAGVGACSGVELKGSEGVRGSVP